jgi:hypothetical protein
MQIALGEIEINIDRLAFVGVQKGRDLWENDIHEDVADVGELVNFEEILCICVLIMRHPLQNELFLGVGERGSKRHS